MNFQAIEMLYDAGGVKRMHTIRTITENTVAAHTWGAMMLAIELCKHNGVTEKGRYNILVTLLYHDGPEQYTGDAPAPVKRDPRLAQTYHDMETQWYAAAGAVMPVLSKWQVALVKAADCLDLMFHSLTERRMGNRQPKIEECFRNCRNWVRESEVDGVESLASYLEEEWNSNHD